MDNFTYSILLEFNNNLYWKLLDLSIYYSSMQLFNIKLYYHKHSHTATFICIYYIIEFTLI